MKNYRQLIKELPSKKVVMAFGRFQPPTIGHELLVNAVKKIAQKQDADHVIFASKTQDKKSNPLAVDRKVYYLKRMFPKTNFVAANEHIRTFIEAATELSKKYKHLIMLAGSDRVPEYKRLLERYNGDVFNFETIEVVSAGERDPDADNASGMSGTKMREAAKKGDFQTFRKGLPHTLTELDGKRLMNEIRQGMGMDSIKEQVKFETNELREKYHAGEIFTVGSKVTDGEVVYEVVDRGANYITVVNESGSISKKWLDSVQPTHVEEDNVAGVVPEEISFKGYVTKNLHLSEDASNAFQSTIQRYNDGQITDAVAILNALKATDVYLEENNQPAQEKARESLERIDEFAHHEQYWTQILEGRLEEMKFSASDKIKVARVIATALGVEDVEKSSNPEQLINAALRKIRSKPMRPEYVDVVHKMLATADEADINYDKKIVPQKVAEELEEAHKVGTQVEITGGSGKGIKGHIGEIRHGLYKGAPKTYTVYHGGNGAIQVKQQHFKAIKEENTIKVTTKTGHQFDGIIKVTGKDYHIVKHPVSKKAYTVDHSGNTIHEELEGTRAMLEALASTVLKNKLSTVKSNIVTDPSKTPDPQVDNDSDVAAAAEPTAPMGSEVGSTMTHSGESDAVRKMKIKYVHEDLESSTEDDEEELGDDPSNSKLTKMGGLKEEEEECAAEEEELDNLTDKDLDKLADSVDEVDDILDAYEDEELAIVDDETGEHVEELKEENEIISEVLSRIERMKAKARFAKSSAKRQRKLRIALKSRSSSDTINARARKLAVKLMKQRIARKPLNQLSIGEKERLEKIIQRRKVVVNRLAMKLAPRVRKIETQRLAHKSYTK